MSPNDLALANRRLAYWYARRVHRGPVARRLALEDVEGAALLGLVEAARRYDPGRGVKFATYAVHYLRRWVQEAVRQGGVVTAPAPGNVSAATRPAAAAAAALAAASPLLCPRPDPAPDPAERAARADDAERLSWGLRRLHPRDRHVVEAVWFGGETFASVGRGMGLSRARVEQLYRRGMDRLRQLLRPEGGA